MAKPFPHHYVVTAVGAPGPATLTLQTAGAPPLATTLPSQFDGPGDEWSPETLFVAAIADCYFFTLRGIAAKSNLVWTEVEIEASGTLERIDNVSRFTEVTLRVRLEIPPGTREELARRVATRAEETCLVTRSLSAPTRLVLAVVQPVIVGG